MEVNLISTFAEFKELKNIDRPTMMSVLEDIFRTQLIKMYGSADIQVTPRPMYPADGRKIPDIHTRPASLRDDLQSKRMICLPSDGSDVACDLVFLVRLSLEHSRA